jgi:uncharacterized DUF497 family protein
MRFEWDIYKAIANVIKHGISFEAAVGVFDDEKHWLVDDAKHSNIIEKRYKAIGEIFADRSASRKVIVVIFVYRDHEKVRRIVSARLANINERIIYEERRRLGE